MSKVWIFADYSQAEARVVAWAGPVPALKLWFQTGEDVHSNVARMIAKVVQDNKVHMAKNLFATKHWEDYGKGDPERDLAKNTVYGNNYGMGPTKFSLIVGLPEREGRLLQEIYFSLFPEVKTNYQTKIVQWLRESRSVKTPLGREKRFFGNFDEEMKRAAYSYYPQSTVGDLLTDTICNLCTFWDSLLHSKDYIVPMIQTPDEILRGGLDVRLQIHDALGVCIDDDPSIIEYTMKTIKFIAERPIFIDGDPLSIPMDFKIGPSWGTAKEVKFEEGKMPSLHVDSTPL